jgi:hypothetical protein
VRATPSRTAFAALAGYCAFSFLFFGVRLLVEPGRQYTGQLDDPQIPIWSFAWWPHALVNGENPFVTHAVWAPHGVNLAWANTLPPLSLAFAPLTWLAGPIASYNVAAILLPAVSAWAAYLLCRHVTGRTWPSILGGYLFGFSSYMLGHLAGQPQLTAVFLLPLAALLVLRFVEGTLGGRRFALLLGTVLALQLYLALEVAFTLTMALVAALVLAFAFAPERRERLRASLRPLAGAYAIAVLLTAPILYYALTDLRRTGFTNPDDYVADLLNFAVPTHVEAAGAGWAHHLTDRFAGNDTERGVYLGVPILVMLVLFARSRLATPGGRFLLASGALAAYVSLGPSLRVAGRAILPLPTVFGHDRVTIPGVGPKYLPLFNNTLPVRFALYTSLVAAVVAALWLAGQPDAGIWRFVLPAAAVLLLLPNPAVWTTTYTIPPFFTDARYRPCIARDAIVLPQPIGGGGQQMLWQVESDFRFRMAGGRLQTSPPSLFHHPPSTAQISVGYLPSPRQSQRLREYAERFGVTYAVVDEREADVWGPPLDRIAERHEVGGVLLYSLAGPLPAGCPAAA